jgi:hypothetical protein
LATVEHNVKISVGFIFIDEFHQLDTIAKNMKNISKINPHINKKEAISDLSKDCN